MNGVDEVERRLTGFRARYDEFPVVTVEKTVPPANFESAAEEAGEIVDVRVWVEREGEVLLVRDRDATDVWMEPGGTPESDENCERTARRETAEETGIDCEIVDLRGVVRHVVRERNDPSTGAQLLQAFYEARYQSGTVRVPTEEIHEGRWWATVPENFHSALGPPESFE